MKNIVTRRNTSFLLAFVMAAGAQAVPEAGAGIGQAMKQNAEALKHYSYKRRTEVALKGQTRGARVDLVRYIDGRMETVPLEAPVRPAGGGSARGLRGKMIEKKRDEIKENVEKLKGLLQNYAPGSDSVRSILEKASITRTGPEPNADVKVQANGLKKPSDSFTLIWSPANHRPARLEIRTDFEGKPVDLTVEYAALPGGPFYAARTVLSAPKKDLNITIDTFDYSPMNAAQ